MNHIAIFRIAKFDVRENQSMKSATKKAAPKKKAPEKRRSSLWARPQGRSQKNPPSRPRFPGPFSLFQALPLRNSGTPSPLLKPACCGVRIHADAVFAQARKCVHTIGNAASTQCSRRTALALRYSSGSSPVSSARFSNLVCACRKTRLTVPTGPLRCLAMISSARPRRSSRSRW